MNRQTIRKRFDQHVANLDTANQYVQSMKNGTADLSDEKYDAAIKAGEAALCWLRRNKDNI